MAKRAVKVSGYVRMHRKGSSVLVTTVRPYERKRPMSKGPYGIDLTDRKPGEVDLPGTLRVGEYSRELHL